MGCRVLRPHIWGYSVCQCPIKRTPGLYGSMRRFILNNCLGRSGAWKSTVFDDCIEESLNNLGNIHDEYQT